MRTLKSARGYVQQATKSHRRLKNVTGEAELTQGQRNYRRTVMRENARAAGLPEPTEADFEAAGVGYRTYDKNAAQQKIDATMRARANRCLRFVRAVRVRSERDQSAAARGRPGVALRADALPRPTYENRSRKPTRRRG
jgi:hypothetical protein